MEMGNGSKNSRKFYFIELVVDSMRLSRTRASNWTLQMVTDTYINNRQGAENLQMYKRPPVHPQLNRGQSYLILINSALLRHATTRGVLLKRRAQLLS